MKFPRHPILVMSIFSLLPLAGCSSGAKVDVRHPTVQQMDDLDVQWGLPKRKPRGAPSRSYNYDGGVAPIQSPVSAPPPAVAPVPALPDPPLEVPTPPPSIPDQLR